MTHRGHRSRYGEECQIVSRCAFWDREAKETINILDPDTSIYFPEGEYWSTIANFEQGEVLSNSRGEGSLQKIREL